jgi:hypothetical protein
LDALSVSCKTLIFYRKLAIEEQHKENN